MVIGAAPLLLLALQVPGRDSLHLRDALALALARRGQVAAAAAGVAGARAEARASTAVPNPVASLEYTDAVPRGHATLEQSLDWLLRRGSLRAAGRAAVAGAAADSARQVAAVRRETRTAFYGLLAAERTLALARDESALADSLAGIASRRLDAGEISDLERGQAVLEAVRSRRDLSTSREQAAAARASLARALGVAPDAMPPLAGALDDGLRDTLPALPDLDALPVVAMARNDSAASSALFTAARRGRVPVPAIVGGVEWGDPTVTGRSAFGVLGLSLPLPLWQSGGAEAAAAGARADQAGAALRETRAEAARLVAETSARVGEAGRRALLARDSIAPLAERQRARALQAYRAGETGLVATLDALRVERQVARDLVADLLDYQLAVADWLELTGSTP